MSNLSPAPVHPFLYNINYDDPIPSGIYALTNVSTGRLYVGSTKGFTRRASQHFRALEEGIHHNRDLQADWDAHDGASSYSFIILERVSDVSFLELAEQRWLNRLKHRAMNWQRHVRRPAPIELGEGADVTLPWEED